MRDKAISIRSADYGLEVERLLAEHPQAIKGMAADLMIAGILNGPDYDLPGMMLRVNDRYHELSGDHGAFLGSVTEAIQKVAKEADAKAREIE